MELLEAPSPDLPCRLLRLLVDRVTLPLRCWTEGFCGVPFDLLAVDR